MQTYLRRLISSSRASVWKDQQHSCFTRISLSQLGGSYLHRPLRAKRAAARLKATPGHRKVRLIHTYGLSIYYILSILSPRKFVPIFERNLAVRTSGNGLKSRRGFHTTRLRGSRGGGSSLMGLTGGNVPSGRNLASTMTADRHLPCNNALRRLKILDEEGLQAN